MGALINTNIRYLRKSKGFTQQELADKLGIKRSLIGSYEEGRAKPNLIVQQELTKLFNITLDQLVTIDLAVYDQQAKKTTATKPHLDVEGRRLRVLSVTVGKDQQENIELVQQKASAGYLNGFADPDYLEQLPRFRLPFLAGGTYRAFEIKGDSMLPVQPGSIIIGEYIDNWKEIKDGHTYVVVSATEGVVYKRVFSQLEDNETLVMQSDNPSYPAFSIKAEDVLEVWKAKAYISTIFPDADASIPRMMNMLAGLQQEMAKMRKQD